MDALALLLAAALPWAAGCAALLAARWPAPASAERASGRIASVAGYGYFVGVFLLTTWMRLLSATGIGFGRISIAAPLALLAMLAIYRARGARSPLARFAAFARSVLQPPLPLWQRIVWLVLLAFMGLRLSTLAVEVAVRPLYPWDAWTRWATKARVWYEFGRMMPFLPGSSWLAAPSGAYFDASPASPATIPLLQAWSAIALGRWDDSATNWPWLLMLVALALAIYGMLRDRGLPPLGALTGAYLVASLPLLDTHVALAGYADLMLAGTYTLASLALARWASTRDLRDGAIAVGLALGCPFIEASGSIWASTLIPAAIVASWPRPGLKVAASIFGTAVLALAVLARDTPLLPGLTLHLTYQAPWRSLTDALFLQDNWHLLWYGALVLAIVRARRLLQPRFAPLVATAAAALAWLLAGSMFAANIVGWFPEASVVSRSALVMAPLTIFLCALLWQEPTPSPDQDPSTAKMHPIHPQGKALRATEVLDA